MHDLLSIFATLYSYLILSLALALAGGFRIHAAERDKTDTNVNH